MKRENEQKAVGELRFRHMDIIVYDSTVFNRLCDKILGCTYRTPRKVKTKDMSDIVNPLKNKRGEYRNDSKKAKRPRSTNKFSRKLVMNAVKALDHKGEKITSNTIKDYVGYGMTQAMAASHLRNLFHENKLRRQRTGKGFVYFLRGVTR